MYGATNRKLIITPSAEGLLRIPANSKAGYIDVRCYYSPHFSSTLLSESDLILSTGAAGNYSGQSTTKYFDWDNDTIEKQLSNGIISFQKHYNLDSGNCIVTCHHKNNKRKDLIIYGTIISGQCYTHPIILPNDGPTPIPPSKSIDDRMTALQAVYEHQEESFRCMLADPPTSGLNSDIPVSTHNLSLKELPMHALKIHSQRKLWHNRLGHLPFQALNQAHKYVDGVPHFKGEPL